MPLPTWSGSGSDSSNKSDVERLESAAWIAAFQGSPIGVKIERISIYSYTIRSLGIICFSLAQQRAITSESGPPCIMISFRKRKMDACGLEAWTPWWVEKCRQAYRLAAEAGHNIIDREWACRYWTWSGHVAREQDTFPWQLVQYRSIHWWRHEQQLQCGWRHAGKRGNVWRWESPLQSWADMHHGSQSHSPPWHVYAFNRQAWRDLLPSFLQSLAVRVDKHVSRKKQKRKRE